MSILHPLINNTSKFNTSYVFSDNRLIKRLIHNTTVVILILYEIIIVVGSVLLDLKFDELVTIDIISVVILYFVSAIPKSIFNLDEDYNTFLIVLKNIN